MISRHTKLLRKPAKNSRSLVVERCNLTMHRTLPLVDRRTAAESKHLMSKADSEDRNPSLKSPDCLHTHSRIPRTLRSRGKDDPLRVHFLNLLHRDLVTAPHQDLSSQFLKVSLEIIYK